MGNIQCNYLFSISDMDNMGMDTDDSMGDSTADNMGGTDDDNDAAHRAELKSSVPLGDCWDPNRDCQP